MRRFDGKIERTVDLIESFTLMDVIIWVYSLTAINTIGIFF